MSCLAGLVALPFRVLGSLLSGLIAVVMRLGMTPFRSLGTVLSRLVVALGKSVSVSLRSLGRTAGPTGRTLAAGSVSLAIMMARLLARLLYLVMTALMVTIRTYPPATPGARRSAGVPRSRPAGKVLLSAVVVGLTVLAAGSASDSPTAAGVIVVAAVFALLVWHQRRKDNSLGASLGRNPASPLAHWPTHSANISASSLLLLSPSDFERTVADLLRRRGYRDVRRVGGAGDVGLDVWCRDAQGRTVAVQCKRYQPAHRVGSPEIQHLIAMSTVHHRTDRAMFVTTSGYTQPAVALARQHAVQLIDGAELSRMLRSVRSTK